MINNTPNTRTGASTPVQLITGRRAIAYGFTWGQPVFVYDNRQGATTAEKGIIVNVRVNGIGLSLKIFLPMRGIAVMRSRNVDFAGKHPDSAWGWVANSIPRGPSSNHAVETTIGSPFPTDSSTESYAYEGADISDTDLPSQHTSTDTSANDAPLARVDSPFQTPDQSPTSMPPTSTPTITATLPTTDPVVIERISVMSSAIPPVCGNSSDNSIPHPP
jgi:hypothetical protein